MKKNATRYLAAIVTALPAAVPNEDALAKIDGVESIGEGDKARLMVPLDSIFSKDDESGHLVLTADAVDVTTGEGDKAKTFRFAVEDVAGLKSTVDRLKTAAGNLKSFEALGSLEEVGAAVKLAAELGELDGGSIEEKANALATSKIEKNDAENQKARKPLIALVNKLVRDAAIEGALDKANVLPEHRDAVRAMIEPQVELSLDEIDPEKLDEIVPTIKGKDGKPRMTDRSNSTDNMTVEELATGMRDSHKAYFAGDNGEGGGATGNEDDKSGAGDGDGTTKKLSEMDDKEKRDYAKEHGSAALGDLAAEETRQQIRDAREASAEATKGQVGKRVVV
jgi:hypothetical protein